MADMLLELPKREGLSRLDRDLLILAAREVCRRFPGDSRVGFHTRDERIVKELKSRHIRAFFIAGDGCPGWWFINATDVCQHFGTRTLEDM